MSDTEPDPYHTAPRYVQLTMADWERLLDAVDNSNPLTRDGEPRWWYLSRLTSEVRRQLSDV